MNFKKLTITLQDESKFRLLLYTIILIAGSILWFFRILIYLNLFENPHDPTGGEYWFRDYRDYYEASTLYLKGQDFYNQTGFYYTPISIFFFLPLAYLPYKISAWVFFLFNLVILFVTFEVIFSILANYSKIVRENEKILLIFSIFLFYPVSVSFIMGQINILILFVVVLVYYVNFIKKRTIITSFLIFLGTIFKIWPFILSIMNFFVDKSKKLFFYSTLLVVIGMFASLSVFDLSTCSNFLIKLLNFQKIRIYEPIAILEVKDPLESNCSFFNSLSKIFSVIQVKYDDNVFLLIKLFIALIILNFLIILKNKPLNIKEKQIHIFNLIITSFLFLSNVFWIHYFCFLILSYLFYIYVLKTSFMERMILLTVTFLISFQEYIVFTAKMAGGYLASLVYIFPPTSLALICFFGLVINSTVKVIRGK